jgi:two-component system, cell cycle sensor histidine kinase and response regulator CckA
MDAWLAAAAVSIFVNGVFAWRWRNRDRLLSRLGREATVRGDQHRADAEALLRARAGFEQLKRDAQLDLQRSEMRYRALADSSPVGIWHLHPDGRTLYLNSAMSEILELEAPGELIGTGQTFHAFFSPESAEIIRRETARRKAGERWHYEVEVAGRYGRRTRMIMYAAPVMDEEGKLESIVGTFVDITERKREEEALRRSEERMRVAAECGTDLIYEWDMPSGVLEWFGPIDERLGYKHGEILRSLEGWEALLHPDDRQGVLDAIEKHQRAHATFLVEYRVRCKDGSWRVWRDQGTAMWDANGMAVKWIGAVSDVTDARSSEEALRQKEDQLRQSQKLEAVGRLAGGIAHDFNNLLAAIMGYCELMLLRLEPGHAVRREVGEILIGSERAAGLIRQLLAFSRQEIPQPKVIQPNYVLGSMERMLRHLLEENIELSLSLDPKAGRVRIDPVQLEQVVMNLVVNARDAMPDGGTLVLSTGNVDLAGDIPGAYGRVHPGPYVRISVADSGQGIGLDDLPRIFDPFFTTKNKVAGPKGRTGSGLGLSTVYGIVTQNQGCVLVETEVDKGSLFSCYLPFSEEDAEEETEVKKALRSSSIFPKTVLVVEDDDEVRSIVRELLSRQGFLVLEARQGREALSLAEKYTQPVHLLLTDVVMPGMGGRELADALGKFIPSLRVLFMSGYTQDSVFRKDVPDGGRSFIQKPFTMSALEGKIREVLV